MSSAENELEKYRKEIDKLNSEIVKLLAKRLVVVKKIGAYKKITGMKVYDRKREKIILEKLKAGAKKMKINEDYVVNIFRSIMKNSRKIEKD